MNKKLSIEKNFINALVTLATITFCACNNQATKENPITDNLDSLHFTVETAPEWDALFKRQHGWFGGDGIFSIPLNGKENVYADDSSKTLILFSDTVIGDIINDSLQNNFSFVRNSVAILKGKDPVDSNIHFYWAEERQRPATMFVPKIAGVMPTDAYWNGDGFVNTATDSSINFFAFLIRQTKYGLGFAEAANAMIKIDKTSKPPYSNYKQTQTPFFLKPSVDTAYDYGSYGSGILVNTKAAGVPDPDGYVYVYGMQGQKKNVLVARVLPVEFDQFDKWKFYDGKEWNADIDKSAAITDSASNELSVSPLPDGRYAMIFQVNGISPYVGLRLGKTPYGPFGKVIKIWNCDDVLKTSKNFITYNAKAHPSLSKPGELLISYNVNSTDFFNDIRIYPNLYRPRFIRLKLLP
ncbi:DUF4185 domain-containing protein [Panacibacter ginsenosidivorans]|uniref:DUF4185 domain-containing protein n=1 Tax=Panacibacter ginsenosidivorans TaxID=1813871 RepID=A0A5B8V8H0_9BACT|nr:DUF4185 domain-containing protein [Panacibacter ginsenosidivorans]QEC66668.1 DUF4185 domain-containing protein [Panacibacter ginsenosidivorans]